MQKKPLPAGIMVFSFLAMLLIDLFAVRISSITLMLISAAVSLSVFLTAQYGRKGAVSK